LKRRVLIADDDAMIRDSRAWCLRAGGWLVEETSTGEETLFVACTFFPDVVVIDVRLPGVDGMEVIRRIKRDVTTKDILIVAYASGEASQLAEQEKLARLAGCDDFTLRSGTPEGLRALLDDLVDGWRFGPTD
jgi:CheY-like chemotaxis protein